MKIGIDFDNTIANYDEVFYQAAVEWELIPQSLETSKKSVRDYLRNANQEDEWTKLQGYVYGDRMDLAKPYPSVDSFFNYCQLEGIETFIISHKTKHPYLGFKYDLHAAAKGWLETQSFAPDLAFFELTLKEKLRRIDVLNCDYFIDDLPEILAEKIFPPHVKKILFDPANHHSEMPGVIRVTSWDEVIKVIQ
ncbi:MAG: hypothetical protein P0S93_03795 [Candidatus Neptunochlamydia sp.]|nr:hypothetical protein [Candidatus Neptunochlamydia sp.]